MTARSVPVALGARSYDIVIGEGVIDAAGARLAALLSRPRAIVVTDETVAALHLPALVKSLEASGLAVDPIILPPGEGTKSFTRLEALCAALLDLGVERNDNIVAFGGGVIGDLTGFAAAIVKRGCGFIQIPTTLLAQVDSSVGGKTGVNVAQGKNLVGAFHQPALVLADTRVLDTLPKRELLAGYAEIAKYGLLGDAAFFGWLEANGAAVVAGDAEARAHAIEVSCKTKARIVAADERERGERALLNLGHTFGHALEAAMGYSGALLHGEAVAAGMAMAFRFSARLGVCSEAEAARAGAHLAHLGLPVKPADIKGGAFETGALIAAMRQDKKADHGRLVFVLARGVGQAFVAHDIAEDALAAFLDSELGT